MRTAAEKRQAERLADLKAKVGDRIERIMELLDMDESKRERARAMVTDLFGTLVQPEKPKPKPPLRSKNYLVRVQEFQQWYQPMRVVVRARSLEEAAAKGIRDVRMGGSHGPDGDAQLLEVDECDWSRLQLDGVAEDALRSALRSAGVSMETCADAVCVASIRRVEVEELP